MITPPLPPGPPSWPAPHPPSGLAAPPAPPVVGPKHLRPAEDPREPRTRPKLMFFDRVKVLVILVVLLAFSVAKRHSDIPIMSWGDAIREQLRAKSWILWVAAIEVVRQAHFLLAERSPGYYRFWERKVWGAWGTYWDKRNPWLRYRLGRLVKVVVWTALLAFFFASLWGVTPLQAISEAPSRLWNNPFGSGGMPWFVPLLITLTFGVGQFALIFWFMSKGGVDTYMPSEVKTRFDDVWGQDHVLEKVKENIVFLEQPASIESKGGHVPGGLLLWGPPGTGKTLMAEAVAGETGRPYVFVDPGAFINMFFGVGILKVKSLFRKLRKLSLKYGGVIVFFDEADTLGNRGQLAGGFNNMREASTHFQLEHGCNGLHYVSPATARRLQSEWLAGRAASAEPAAPEAGGGLRHFVVGGMAGGGGGMGTLQALLTELSGLKKPRGFVTRRIRAFLNIRPKQPPKYRLLVMMATNMPEALDEALLRPGRIDRIYKVDYPTLDGRIRTFEGYLDKISHTLSKEQVQRLAVMSPRASGAVIKDIVNEALIVATRKGRDYVTWPDVLEARVFKIHGMADGVAATQLEQHETAVHEASHAVAMYLLQRRSVIDIATIEQRGAVGGFVSPVPVEERKFEWRVEMEDDIVTFLVSLAGERHFFGGDNSMGVGGDLAAATRIVSGMLATSAMGRTLSSYGGLPIQGPSQHNRFADQVEGRLQELMERAQRVVAGNEWFLMAVAHALEAHRTVSGEDIDAIYKGVRGPTLDGGVYHRAEFVRAYSAYHQACLDAHRHQTKVGMALPRFDQTGPIDATSTPALAPAARSPWSAPVGWAVDPGPGGGTIGA